MLKENTKVLVTGAAGFIGAALVHSLLKKGAFVVGIDNLNDYYEPTLKRSRLNLIEKNKIKYSGTWKFHQISIDNEKDIEKLSNKLKFDIVINLAAQAGVRHSINAPKKYILSNLVGFSNILELCRESKVKNFIYASSSSVYGGNHKIPFNEEDTTDHQLNLYGATKKANESLAHSYSNLFSLPTIGLRFFTVYGPWGRPDMAPMIFAKSILNNTPIKIYNYGQMTRDFTYINDVVEAIVECCYKPATVDDSFNKVAPNLSTSFAPNRIFNVGYGKPVNLLNFIELLEEALGKIAIKRYMPIQPGEVQNTHCDNENLFKWIGKKPRKDIKAGVKDFASWYLNYYS